jgi:hypothetical protein
MIKNTDFNQVHIIGTKGKGSFIADRPWLKVKEECLVENSNGTWSKVKIIRMTNEFTDEGTKDITYYVEEQNMDFSDHMFRVVKNVKLDKELASWNMSISKTEENNVIFEHLSTSSLIKLTVKRDDEFEKKDHTLYLNYSEITSLINIINRIQE